MSDTHELTFAQAIREAQFQAMSDNPKVCLIGLGVSDPIGVFGTTLDLVDEFGPERVIDVPVSENAITGTALGMALTGMRPIMTHLRLEFALPAMDQIVNQAAKWHYMFGGQSSVPMVIRMIVGRGWGQGAQHSQSLHAWFTHIPGLKVIMPSTPHDAKGLLLSAIDDDNPTIIIEHRWLYNLKEFIPKEPYKIPFGQARIVRDGKDVTIVSSSFMTIEALKAAKELSQEGIQVDLIDLRSLAPLDLDTIVDSVRKTGRLVVCDHATYTGSFAGEIIAQICEKAFNLLKASPERVTLPDLPTPTTRALSNFYYPQQVHIQAAVKRCLGLSHGDPWRDINPDDHLDVPDTSFTGPF